MWNKFGLHSTVYGAVSVLGIITTFLPWVKIPPIATLNGTNSYGWISLILFLVVLFFVNKYRKQSYPKIVSYTIGLLGLIIAMIGTWSSVQIRSIVSDLDKSIFPASFINSVTIDIGVYLLIFCGAALTISIGIFEFFITRKNPQTNDFQPNEIYHLDSTAPVSE